MSKRVPRNVWRRFSCTGKAKIPNEKQARQSARSLALSSGEKIDAYACRWCGLWHVGHVPGTKPDPRP